MIKPGNKRPKPLKIDAIPAIILMKPSSPGYF